MGAFYRIWEVSLGSRRPKVRRWGILVLPRILVRWDFPRPSDWASSRLRAATFLQIIAASGIDLTDRLTAGASLQLGTGTFDGIFVGSGRAAYDYALRGTVGLDYELGMDSTFGFYYQTKQSFTFDDAIRLDLGGGLSLVFDINLDLPDNIGFGIANESLLDGRLLLATDVLYKQWDNADLFRALYRNQWVVQIGAQYTYCRMKLRMGYAYADNPIAPNPGTSSGGISPPGAQAAIEYAQALVGVINKHRISGGVGIEDVLPGIDIDLFAGGMFEDSQQRRIPLRAIGLAAA